MNPESRFRFERGFAEKVEREDGLSFLPKLYADFPEAEWYLVGGAVRDFLLSRDAHKDYDLVVRRLALEDLRRRLDGLGKVNLVGRVFGVLKFEPKEVSLEEPVDIAWPRTERAGMSGGYRDFDVQADPELEIERDLARRDFTVNAIAWDLKLQRFVDPFEGRADIDRKTLRAVGDPRDRFQEDYSRMLRGLRLACQLGFEIEPGTWDAIRELMPHINDVRTVESEDGGRRTERVVPHETIAREFVKALAADPVRAVELFESSGALFRIIPELERLKGCEQPPDHHSEGDVWTHTKLAVAKLHGSEFSDWFPGEKPAVETTLAVLLHDSGKPQTAARDGDRVTFHGHDEAGAEPAKRIAERLRLSTVPGAGIDADRLSWLVRMHLFPNLVDVAVVRRTTLAKHFLADPLAGRELLHLAFADAAGSIPSGGSPDLSQLRRLFDTLAELKRLQGGAKPKKLLTGNEIMNETGLAPGPEVGRILEALSEAQLGGAVMTHEEAVQFLKKLHGNG